MIRLLGAAGLVLVGANLALVVFVALSGAAPIGAADGHWRVTDWLLETGKQRAVALRGRTVEVPPLDDPALVQRGAGHFETACRRCHGAPGEGPPAVLAAMHPRPPDLLRIRDKYPARELFQIVRYGLNLTGMPAWPVVERDDEVWAMVALLEALPALGRSGYLRLAEAEPASAGANAPAVVRAQCARCHGIDGRGRVPGAFPMLAGQHADYLYRTLHAYASGARHSAIMTPVAIRLSDEDMKAASGFYGGLPGLTASPPAATADPRSATGAPLERVPACGPCHVQAELHQPAYPRLGGQDANYLAQQLRLFAERRRGGTTYAPLMHHVADEINEHQRRAAAAFFAGQQR